jgi:hypothetical protein
MALHHACEHTCACWGVVDGRGMLLPSGSGPLCRLVKTRKVREEAGRRAGIRVTAIGCPLLLAGFALKGRQAF